jgi:hypothetical protein
MGDRAEAYRAELRRLNAWEPYLKKHSGLPGPRANLELVAAVAEEADADRLWHLSTSEDEFLALCGVAGLGRVALIEPDAVLKRLHEMAADPRWRVREGVAMALQRIGREDMPALLALMARWADEEEPFVRRAVVAGLCEPAILGRNEDAVGVLEILDRITSAVVASSDRRGDGHVALRKALGYGWSVAAAAAPENAIPYIQKWMGSQDRDVVWIMKSNLAKSRMAPLLQKLRESG